MPKYSKTSKRRLADCHPRLQELFNEVIKHYDCSILCGRRTKAEQDAAYNSGTSKVKFPNSKHNPLPSLAVDAAPYPIDWNNHERFRHFAGFVQGVAAAKGIKIRWGGDWDMDNDLYDQSFMDLVHFEVIL